MAAPAFPAFRSVSVRNPTADSLLVRWSIVPTAYDMSQIAFEILRSDGPKGPWAVVGTAEQGAFHFADLTVLAVQGFRSYYYKVRAANIRGGQFVDSDVKALDHDPDNIALAMIRKKNLFFRVRGGVSAAVLIRKRWGPKCTRCWDNIRMVCTDADCRQCYGVGIIGGYLNPVFLHAALFNSSVKQYISIDNARYAGALSNLELGNMPPVSPDDIIIDRVVNSRYIIKRVVPFTHRMYLVAQQVEVVMKDENDVINTIPIPEDLPSIQGKSYDLARSDV